MRTCAALAALASSCVLLASPRAAEANGRFPNAGQIALRPGPGPVAVFVQATYGLVTLNSQGDGRWICEQSAGYGGEQDPPIAVAEGDHLLVAPAEGARVSVDGGCVFERPEGALLGAFTTDLTVDPSDPSRVYATTSTATGPGPSLLARSDDAGRSFAPVSTIGDDLLTLTVEVAPSDADRVVVTALAGSAYAPVVLVSDDGGSSWLRRELSVVGAPYLSAIDPADPDRFYLRVDADGDDALYLSVDAGESFERIATSTGPMLGFALSPDGTTIAIGGPQMGVRVADASALEFVDAARTSVRCLRWHESGLYACGDSSEGLIVGRSFDGGQSFEPMLGNRDLEPLACRADTPTAELCPAAWPAVASLLGAGSTGASTSSGSGASGGESSRESGGCGLSRSDAGSSWAALLLGGTALALGRRRRNRTRVLHLGEDRALPPR